MEEQEKRPIGGKRLAPEDRGSFWSNWGYLIVTAAVIVVLFKVIFQLSWVPSGSMETTIPEHTLLISWQLPYMVSDPTPERGGYRHLLERRAEQAAGEAGGGSARGRHRVPGRLYLCQR